MKLRFWNRNYVGTHFGGSLLSMTDPFIKLMLMRNLGRDYIVWDKSSSIEFVAPGRGEVFAHFRLSDEDITSIREKTNSSYKYEPDFDIEIKDIDNKLIARVSKKLYIRRKDVK